MNTQSFTNDPTGTSPHISGELFNYQSDYFPGGEAGEANAGHSPEFCAAKYDGPSADWRWAESRDYDFLCAADGFGGAKIEPGDYSVGGQSCWDHAGESGCPVSRTGAEGKIADSSPGAGEPEPGIGGSTGTDDENRIRGSGAGGRFDANARFDCTKARRDDCMRPAS